MPRPGLRSISSQGKPLGRPPMSAVTDAAIRKALKKATLASANIAATLGLGTVRCTDQGGDVGVKQVRSAY